MSRPPLGAWGEALAAAHLERLGWSILERNYRALRNEIDLVARRGEVVAFVEVKTRTRTGHGHPLEAIGARKRRGLALAASAWIASREEDPRLVYRFDAIAVSRGADGEPRIEHVEDAWRL